MAKKSTQIFSKKLIIFGYIKIILKFDIQNFSIKDCIKKEYDYFFKTNNYGLVNYKDIFQDKGSILFLGDSFL